MGWQTTIFTPKSIFLNLNLLTEVTEVYSLFTTDNKQNLFFFFFLNIVQIINILISLKYPTYPIPPSRNPLSMNEDLTLIPVDDLAVEAGLAHFAVDLEPPFLGEDGAEVSKEALYALLTLFG